MEFYSTLDYYTKLAISGFNSQRDGILRASFTFARPTQIVSIPNGMNFYFTS